MHVLSFLFFTLLCARALAQLVTCDGSVVAAPSTPFKIDGSVLVDGATCSLTNVIITGDVQLLNNGVLNTFGVTTMQSISGAGSVTLDGGSAVTGDVTIMTTMTNTLTVKSTASIGGMLSVTGPVETVLSDTATLGSVEISQGSLSMNGGSVQDITMMKGTAVDLCKANIKGRVRILETTGNIMVGQGMSCGAVSFGDLVDVRNGNGLVDMSGSTFTNLEVLMNTGKVSIKKVSVSSSLEVANTEGDVLMDEVDVNFSASISDNSGAVTLKSSKGGRFSIRGSTTNDPVIIKENSGISSLLIENNAGDILVENNVNNIGNVQLLSNKDGAILLRNTFNTLNCERNIPAPSCLSNTIANPTGQCLAC